MLRRRKPPQLSPDEALRAKPVRLVTEQIEPTPDGGTLTVALRPGRVGGWLFRLPAGATKTFEFDPVGLFVWQHIDGNTSVKQLIRHLSRRHHLTLREAEVPTLAFLKTLIAKGLVAVPVDKRGVGSG